MPCLMIYSSECIFAKHTNGYECVAYANTACNTSLIYTFVLVVDGDGSLWHIVHAYPCRMFA